MLGANRALVSDIAGTTVDPIEGFFDLYFGKDALKLEEDLKLKSTDNLLYKQYEDFRKNNPELYESLVSSYNTEEEIEEETAAEIDEESLSVLDSDNTEFISEREKKMYDQVFHAKEESGEKEVEQEVQGSYWRSIHIVDTAGIRKQKKIDDFIESQSVYRSLRCITEADICVYMIDAEKGVSHQDKRLLDIAIEKGTSVIVCLNKIDLIADKIKDPEDRKEWLLNIRDTMPWLNYCDVLPISAKNKKGIKALKRALIKTILIRKQVLPTGELNRFVLHLTERHPIILKGSRGKRFKIKYASQIKSDPPTFLFFTNKSKGVPDNYRRYLKNGLRTAFPLDNTPIHLIFRTGSDLQKRMTKVSKS